MRGLLFDGPTCVGVRAVVGDNLQGIGKDYIYGLTDVATWDVTDIAAVAEIAHAGGAMLAADSTCSTPVITRPFEHGADIVMHSATKYLNGHSDLIAGALVTKEKTAYWDRVLTLRAQLGGVLGSFEAWLLLRGMRTLYPRVKTACANAMAIAERLSANPNIAEVLYPGLKNFPGHAIEMPPPLSDGQVTFDDGSPATVAQYSKDVATFLTWTAEPHMEARKRIGLQVFVFLILLTLLLYFTKKKVWADAH